jgi:sterol desaturase/sphingolipid hydroxylase (fatty acid hydroxylase superfamily)
MWVLLSILLGFVFSEVVGYIVHQLLHSEKIPYLSRSHMIHHLKHYGPKMSMRSDAYLMSIEGRASIGTVGLEWMGPLAVVSLLSIGSLLLLGAPLLYVIIGYVAAVTWGVVGFSMIHDAMHIRNVWLLRNPVLGRWFRRVRRLHDIHHVQINDSGKMQKNFGMCFYLMDKLFGTYSPSLGRFNENGYEKAKERYSFINKE